MDEQLKKDLAEFIELDNGVIRVVFCNIGASIVSIFSKDRQGNYADVVLGYDQPKDYDQFGPYLGAVCGRVANRIAKGKFKLNGIDYQLDTNNGENHLHGGKNGLSRRLFTYDLFNDKVVFTTRIKDGEDGYPGNLTIVVTYTLQDNELIIDYHGNSDQDTLLSLTNHSYFNLNGHDSGEVLDHYLTIYSDQYIPIDETSIPLGYKSAVTGTAFDFRVTKKVGQDIKQKDQQLLLAQGYDHSYCVGKKAAELYSADSGRLLEVFTTCEAMQLYTGNFLDEVVGKATIYRQYGGLCLETQFHPDAINQPAFTKPLLLKGENYSHQTIFRFSIK